MPRRLRSPGTGPLCIALAAALSGPAASAYELYDHDGLKAEASMLTRAGIRYGTGINYGVGALTGFGQFFSSTGEEERIDLQLGVRPRLTVDYTLPAAMLYGGVSVVAATTTLDGELSGQFARSGDSAFNTDEAFVGVRGGVLDFTYGAQEFTIGDGLIIGDGTFNMGHDNGQYWIGVFSAWRNGAVLKVNTAPVRGDFYWLRTDDDLGDSRVAGINIENSDAAAYGTIGGMYFEIFDDDGAAGLDGMRVAGIRGEDLHLPAWPRARFWAEYIVQRGESELTGLDNDADAWYLEGQYRAEDLPWTPQVSYRYARFSGNEAATADSEEFRALFFTIGQRDWDSWYMGEITGEFHLFNQNQVTQIAKVRAFPRPGWTLGAAYLNHVLEEPHYFGIPVTDTDWSDEVNAWIEHYPTERVYLRAEIAWATPGDAAEQIFGDDDQAVVELFVQYVFK